LGGGACLLACSSLHHSTCCPLTHPCLQYTKLADDKWYPGKVLGGKDKQKEKLGERPAPGGLPHAAPELGAEVHSSRGGH